MQLDTVLTLAIGRDGTSGTLPAQQWRKFRKHAQAVIAKHAQIVAVTAGGGIASDDNRIGKPEQSAVILAINPKNTRLLRTEVARILQEFQQSSCAFSIQRNHRPIFATSTGNRAR